MHAEERWRRDELLDDLDLAGIAGALVLHAQTLYYDPMLANRELIEQIAAHRERLFPCWMALPALSGDFPDVPDFMVAARTHDVRAVRLEPQVFGLPLDETLWAELRDALRAESMLVITSTDEGFGGDFTGLDRFLTVFSGSNVLLLNAVWSQWRNIIHLMNKHPQLHLEFTGFQANRAVEYCAGRYGAERCLFGTGLPKKAPGAARGFLDWSLLPDAEVAKVAGANLVRLLGGHGPKDVPCPGPWSDELTAAARHGEPLPCRVVDDHCHVLHDGGCNAGKTRVMIEGGVDGMVELTRRIGVDRTAIMSWAGPLSGDVERGNTIVANAVDRYPTEFVGVATVRPELQTPEEIDTTIHTYHVQRRFPGLKPFPRVTQDFDDPGFDSWFKFASDNRLYMVFDYLTSGPAGTPMVEYLTSRYPGMTLHLDHCARSWPYAKWAAEMVQRFPQVYAQLNYTLVTNGVIEYLVETVGADRVLFGTDAPMRDPRPQAAWLVFTRLPESAKRLIFGANFERILSDCFNGTYAQDLATR